MTAPSAVVGVLDIWVTVDVALSPIILSLDPDEPESLLSESPDELDDPDDSWVSALLDSPDLGEPLLMSVEPGLSLLCPTAFVPSHAMSLGQATHLLPFKYSIVAQPAVNMSKPYIQCTYKRTYTETQIYTYNVHGCIPARTAGIEISQIKANPPNFIV